jgi:putative ABC transport system permease protein
MSFLDGWRYRLRNLVARDRFEREMKDEFAFHLTLEQQQQADRADAAFAARRRLGNQTLLEEERRAMAGIGFFDVLRQDLRFAWRSFSRTPGFTLVAVLALAVGIGANTALFSAVNTLLLRPLPFEQPEQLMRLSLTEPGSGGNPGNDNGVWSFPKHEFLRQNQGVFQDLALYTDVQLTVHTGSEAARERVEITDEHYLGTLRVTPRLGRNFLPEETLVNGPRVVLLSDAYWQRHFNADPNVLDQNVNIESLPYRVIGVLPPSFQGLSGKIDLWIPIAALWGESMLEPWSHGFNSVARLANGVHPAQAVAVTREIGPRITEAFPAPSGVQPGWGAMARELDATRVDPIIRRSMLVLFGAVALVLLIACVNVANLLLIRSNSRQREIAVRLALGAGRRRLIRQLLTESLLLAAMGGALGIAVAWWGVQLLSQLDPSSALRGQALNGLGAVEFKGIALDGHALLFTGLTALLTGVLFGLAPAIQATRPSLRLGLGNGATSGSGWQRWSSHNGLAIVEIALALVLLVGSGLMLRSLGRLLSVDTGFSPTNVLTLRLNTDAARDSLPGFYDQMLERLRQLPGVQSVALSDCLPLSGGCNGTVMWYRDRPPVPAGNDPVVGVNWITPDWPGTMGVPLLRGRLFRNDDRAGIRKAVLINATAAARYWPGQDPVGRPISVGQGGFHQDTAYVVGVLGDVPYVAVDQPAQPVVYLPYAQSPRGRMTIEVRTAGDPIAIAAAARGALQEIAPRAPVYDIRTMQSRVGEAMAYARFSALLLGLFATVALALATMGTYGVISFGVSQRTQELGIRAALGASRSDVVRMIARQGATMVLVGGAIGLGGALLVTRVLGSMLYEVPPADPLTFGLVAVVLLVAVAAACLVPARRAALVPPAVALRRS